MALCAVYVQDHHMITVFNTCDHDYHYTDVCVTFNLREIVSIKAPIDLYSAFYRYGEISYIALWHETGRGQRSSIDRS